MITMPIDLRCLPQFQNGLLPIPERGGSLRMTS